jgi:amidophosphoribosyltransferase
MDTSLGPFALAHNGQLTQATTLRNALMKRGVGMFTSSDSEVLSQLIGSPVPGCKNGGGFVERIGEFMRMCDAAYSIVVLTTDGLYAARDPYGMRPLCIGRMPAVEGHPAGYCVSSESCALLTVGAHFEREVQPGELIKIDLAGVHSVYPRGSPLSKSAFCVFEYVYFSRPDSLLSGRLVQVRCLSFCLLCVLESCDVHSLSFSLLHTLPHIHTHTLSLSLIHTHALTHTDTHTDTH